MTIKLNQPIQPNLEILTKYLSQVNDSGWYTNFGPLHQLLTKRLEKYLGVKNLLLVSNGTLALQVAYKTLNVQHALTTPFSFVATTSSLLWQNIQVSYSDIERSSYNLCPREVNKALKADSSIDTIVATHVYGNPCDVNVFEKLSQKSEVKVIYDAAHAFAVKIKDKSVLNYGDASTLSFHATKVFHTIEGGAIIFKNKSDLDRAKRLINFGIDHNGEISEAGINAKLNEYQCAVGLTILDNIDEIIAHRSHLFRAYRDGLKNVAELPIWYKQASFNGAYMPIKLASAKQRKLVEKVLKENNIHSRQYFSPSLDEVFNEQQLFSSANSQELSQNILCLPLHYYMTPNDVQSVITKIQKTIK